MSSRNSDDLFLPDLCGVRPLFLVLLFAQLLAIVLTLAQSGEFRPRFEAFGFISLFTQLIALSIAAVLCMARKRLNRFSEAMAVAAGYGLMLLVTLLVSEGAWWAMLPPDGQQIGIQSSHPGFIGRTIGISAIVNALALRYFFVQHHWRRQTASESRARIQALQSRIRPHFFFNCMNTIAGLTRTRPDAAEQAVEDLASLFRASLSDAATLVSLADEFELARRYLDIEHLRLGERLQLEWSTDALPLDARIPSLTVQPLLENAIYHGIEPLAEGGTIEVEGGQDADQITIVIRNPVVDAAQATQSGNRMAQENIGERLKAHFGKQGNLLIEHDKLRYTVRLNFPYVTSDADINR